MEITIRRGGVPDASAAAELWLRARTAAVTAIPAPVHSETEIRSWFVTHVARDLELWVAEATGGGLLGILVLDEDCIDQLYVDPATTEQGIGSRLLSLAKAERPGGLRLWAFVANTRAQRFYERHGSARVAADVGVERPLRVVLARVHVRDLARRVDEDRGGKSLDHRK